MPVPSCLCACQTQCPDWLPWLRDAWATACDWVYADVEAHAHAPAHTQPIMPMPTAVLLNSPLPMAILLPAVLHASMLLPCPHTHPPSHALPMPVQIIPLGILNALPMLVERRIEYTYLSWSDIILSIPFFSHQNRITSHLFSLALQTQTGAYMASGRGLGNTATSLVEIFNYHAITNFIPGGKLILLVFSTIMMWLG